APQARRHRPQAGAQGRRERRDPRQDEGLGSARGPAEGRQGQGAGNHDRAGDRPDPPSARPRRQSAQGPARQVRFLRLSTVVADARPVTDSAPATRRGRLVVLAGPSAVGKSTVVRRLRSRIPDLHFSVSATTRDPRPGEVDGVDYHFVGRAEVDRMIEAGELLEWADIHGGLQRSGTPAKPVLDALAEGHPVLVEVDLAGARAVRAAMQDAVLAFLAPPSWEVLVERLTGRGTETDE